MSDFSRRNFLTSSAAVSATLLVSGCSDSNKQVLRDPLASVMDVGVKVIKSADGRYTRPFSDEEYAQRLRRIREMMADANLEVLYVTSPEGMCYFTGYQATWYRGGSSTRWPALAALVIHVDHENFIFYDTTDEYMVHQATSSTDQRHWIPDDKMSDNLSGGVEYIVNDLRQRGWTRGRVGMELWSHVPNPAISARLQDAFSMAGAEVHDGTEIIRGVRKIKSPQELSYIEEAAQIADIGLKAVANHVRPGVTQAELQGVAYMAMMAAGGELPAINQGVMSGPLASAHALSSNRPIQPGEGFAVDLSGVVNRYHANVCRSYIYGEPSEEMLRMSKASKEGTELLCRIAKAGASVAEVARTLREFYIDMGVWDYRGWVGGYDLGIAFPPDWVGEWLFNVDAENETGVFEANSVTNYESVFVNPGIGAALGLSAPAAGINIDTIIYGSEGGRSLVELNELPIIVS